MRRRRIALLTLLLLASLVAVPVVLTWREVRQEKLNHALFAAVKRNDATEVVALLNRGADANAPDQSQETISIWRVLAQRWRSKRLPLSTAPTPLQRALESKDERFPFASVQGYPPENVLLIRALLDHGARVNIHPLNDFTPLTYAALGGKNATIRLLLAHGAQTRQDDCALWYAVHTKEVRPDVIADMIRLGAHVNQDNGSITVLELAIIDGRLDVVRVLLDQGVDCRHKDPTGSTPLAFARDWAPFGLCSQQIVRLLKAAGATE